MIITFESSQAFVCTPITASTNPKSFEELNSSIIALFSVKDRTSPLKSGMKFSISFRRDISVVYQRINRSFLQSSSFFLKSKIADSLFFKQKHRTHNSSFPLNIKFDDFKGK